MNTALASKQPNSTPPATASTTSIARRSAIVIGLSLSMAVLGLLTLAPELMESAPLWATWALAMTGVVAAYISGHALRRKMSGRQSRRTRRWISARQG